MAALCSCRWLPPRHLRRTQSPLVSLLRRLLCIRRLVQQQLLPSDCRCIPVVERTSRLAFRMPCSLITLVAHTQLGSPLSTVSRRMSPGSLQHHIRLPVLVAPAPVQPSFSARFLRGLAFLILVVAWQLLQLHRASECVGERV